MKNAYLLLIGVILLQLGGISSLRAEFVAGDVEFKDGAVIVRVEDGIRRVRLRSFNEESKVWELVEMAHLSGESGYIKLRIPDGITAEQLKVEVSATDPFPFSYYSGQSSFGQKTSVDGSVTGTRRTGQDLEANAGAPTEDGGGAEVVESDIWQINGDRLYFFNQLRGLQIFDMKGDPEPEKIGSLRMPAVGEQMYVLDDTYTILLAAWASWNRSEVVLTKFDTENGVQEASRFQLPGSIAETRLIGDLLYVVTRFSERVKIEVPVEPEPEPDPDGEEGEEGEVREETVERWVYTTGLDLTVIDFSDPASPKELEGLRLAEQDNWGFYNAQVAATSSHLLVSTTNYRNRRTTSEVYVIDIADQAKVPELVAQVPAAGQINDKFKMRVGDGVLTTVSQINDWEARRFETVVETFELDDELRGGYRKLDSVGMGLGEQLFATRFHGDRLYVVTFERIDPFWVVDLADPKALKVLGELEVPGFSRYLEPHGDDVLAIGVEDRVVTASLFNASDPKNPVLYSRVSMGEGFSWSEGNYDEKAIKVDWERGLLLVPYQSWNNGHSEQRVQIIDIGEKELIKRGSIEHQFTPRRAGLWNERIVSVSGRELVVVDAENRDEPAVLSNTIIAWNTDRVFQVGEHLVQVEEGYYSYWGGNSPTNSVRVTTTADPDTALSELILGDGNIMGTTEKDGCLHVIASVLRTTATVDEKGNDVFKQERSIVVSVVDISNPQDVKLLGQTELDAATDDTNYFYGGGEVKPFWLPGGELAWTSNGGSGGFCRWCWEVDAVGPVIRDIAIPFYFNPYVEVHVVDISNKAEPRILSSSVVSEERSWSYSEPFLIDDQQIGFSYQKNRWLEEDDRWLQEHLLRIVDLENPAVPKAREEVSLPGTLSSVVKTPGGGTVLITEGQQSAEGETPSERWWNDAYLQASIFDGVTTFLLDEVKIENAGWAPSVFHGAANYRQVSTEKDGIRLLGFVWDEGTGKYAAAEPLKLDNWQSELAIHDEIIFSREWPSALIGIDVTEPLAPAQPERFPLASNIWSRIDRMLVDRSSGAWLPTGAYGVDYVDFGDVFAQAETTRAPRSVRDGDELEIEWLEIPAELLLITSAQGDDFVGSLEGIAWLYIPRSQTDALRGLGSAPLQ